MDDIILKDTVGSHKTDGWNVHYELNGFLLLLKFKSIYIYIYIYNPIKENFSSPPDRPAYFSSSSSSQSFLFDLQPL